MRDNVEIMNKLQKYLDPSYKWPDVPSGWDIEFIYYPDCGLEMDLTHPVARTFWSEENDYLELPVLKGGGPLTRIYLEEECIEVMDVFGYATVSEEPKAPHLTLIK